MRAAPAILIYGAAVVILGALLAPWLFWIVHPHLPTVPFRRVFDRAMLVVALTGLWPLLRALGIRSRQALGFVPSRRWWCHLLVGVGLGVGSFALVGVLLLGVGVRKLATPPPELISALLSFAATGAVVALIEETLFRGGLQGAVQRGTSLPVAICVTSVIYSAVHFLKPKGVDIDAQAVTWLSGFVHLGRIVAASGAAPGAAVGFVTLALAGGVLGLAFAKTGALYLPIGIHAGWVFTLKTYAKLTAATGTTVWWGGAALIDNMVAWPVLLGLLVAIGWLCRARLDSKQS